MKAQTYVGTLLIAPGYVRYKILERLYFVLDAPYNGYVEYEMQNVHELENEILGVLNMGLHGHFLEPLVYLGHLVEYTKDVYYCEIVFLFLCPRVKIFVVWELFTVMPVAVLSEKLLEFSLHHNQLSGVAGR